MNLRISDRHFFLLAFSISLFTSCAAQKNITKNAARLLTDSIISHAHTGISIYEPATAKHWYSHNADKYFVPASNTKLFSLYAGLKYLGDSIPGIKLYELPDKIVIEGMGDPTLLHPDYIIQPVYDFLKKQEKPIFYLDTWTENSWGRGWAWDDFADYYMAERSQLPVYGNAVRYSGSAASPIISPAILDSLGKYTIKGTGYLSNVSRQRYANEYSIIAEGKKSSDIDVPFITSPSLAIKLLSDSLHKPIYLLTDTIQLKNAKTFIVNSRHVDSVYTPMMHRSDNLFAEQVLLMASQKVLGKMSNKDMIDYLLKNDLAGLPQKPQWVDGSGLSRHNLFTPNDMVYVLSKMDSLVGLERLKSILATGGKGTLKYYYRDIAGFIFAKTGTLSNHVALSGYLLTKKNKALIFSVIVNLYSSGATPVRRQVESFLQQVQQEN